MVIDVDRWQGIMEITASKLRYFFIFEDLTSHHIRQSLRQILESAICFSTNSRNNFFKLEHYYSYLLGAVS